MHRKKDKINDEITALKNTEKQGNKVLNTVAVGSTRARREARGNGEVRRGEDINLHL